MSRPDKTFASFMHCLRLYVTKPEGLNLIQEGFGGGQWDITDVPALLDTTISVLSLAEAAHHLSVDMSTVPEATYGEDITRLPYPIMLMHYQNTFTDDVVYDTMLVVTEDEDNEHTMIFPFLRTEISTSLWLPYMFYVQVNWHEDFVADGSHIKEHSKLKQSRIAVAELPGVVINPATRVRMQEAASEIFHALDDVLVLINCANVELESVEPTRLKIARARKKGELIERYSMIKLPGHSKTYKSGVGGHHASPTMHTRRGHYRRHRTDHSQRSWVRPCVVGDLGDGLTHSDYKV